jgi:hypothetical protein
MNVERINPQELTIAKFLALFNQFTRAQQVEIARKIWKKTFGEQWDLLDAELPDMDISEAEILDELRAVRYGKTSSAFRQTYSARS